MKFDYPSIAGALYTAIVQSRTVFVSDSPSRQRLGYGVRQPVT